MLDFGIIAQQWRPMETRDSTTDDKDMQFNNMVTRRVLCPELKKASPDIFFFLWIAEEPQQSPDAIKKLYVN